MLTFIYIMVILAMFLNIWLFTLACNLLKKIVSCVHMYNIPLS